MPIFSTPKDLEDYRQGLSELTKKDMAQIAVCAGSNCESWGRSGLWEALKHEIQKEGLTGKVQVKRSGCMGVCERGPVMVIYPQGIFYQSVGYKDVPQIVNETIKRGNILARLLYTDVITGRKFVYLHQLPFRQEPAVLGLNKPLDPGQLGDYLLVDGYKAFSSIISKPTEEILRELRKARITPVRGGRKTLANEWLKLLKNGGISQVYGLLGEEETYFLAARRLLEANPQVIIEGMLIAGYVLGARSGLILVRPELKGSLRFFRQALLQAREHGLVGRKILGSDFSFDMEIHEVLSYSWPDKPGYYRGYVQTYASLPMLFLKGGDWYAKLKREKRPGIVRLALSGHVNNSGLMRLRGRSTLREIIYQHGGGLPRGHQFKSAFLGGPLGRLIKRDELDLSYRDLEPTGPRVTRNITVYDENNCMVELAHQILGDMKGESCGKCSPCRLGTMQLQEILQRLIQGRSKGDELAGFRQIIQLMQKGSKCQIGQDIARPVQATLERFMGEYEMHLKEGRCPSGACQDLVEAPCKEACPMGVDIPEVIRLARTGDYRTALGLVYRDNPFPGICGRICTHPCENRCMRERMEGGLDIKAIERFIADLCPLDALERFAISRSERVAVIGAGPAGLSCAYFTAKSGYPVEVFEAFPQAGGQLIQAVPEFKLPAKVVQYEIESMVNAGITLHLDRPLSNELNIGVLKEKGFDAIYLAMGAQIPRKVGLPGELEGLEGLYYGLTFLRLARRGQPINLGEKVTVVGGGTVAMSAARTAIRLGAKEVSIYCRRTREEMPSTYEEYLQAQEEGVRFHFLVSPTSILHETWRLTGLRCVRMRLGDEESGGVHLPVPIPGSEFSVATQTLIMAVGHQADLSSLPLEVSCVSSALATGLPGVFAGGEFLWGPGTLVESMAAGKRAALAIRKYLETGDDSMESERKPPWVKEEGPVDLLAHRPRVSPNLPPVSERLAGFNEVEQTLTMEQLQQELDRCLECDRYRWQGLMKG